jgi:hypothetical protein
MWEWLLSNLDLDRVVVFVLIILAFLAIVLFVGVRWQKWSLRDSIALLVTGLLLTVSFMALLQVLDFTGPDRRTTRLIEWSIFAGLAVLFAWLGNKFVGRQRQVAISTEKESELRNPNQWE